MLARSASPRALAESLAASAAIQVKSYFNIFISQYLKQELIHASGMLKGHFQSYRSFVFSGYSAPLRARDAD